jgi:UDP-glucose 4-epimerase
MRVLIPGITGLIARQVAVELITRGHEVHGIDSRPWLDAPEAVKVHVVDIRKRGAAEVFRRFRPEAVIHMATVTHLREKSEDRYRINLAGTRAVFDHAKEHGTKRFVFVGRHTFYGAGPDSPLYHTESEPPMAVHTFPELADLVAADLYAGTALWRFPEMRTAVLRVCYTLGPARHGTLAAFVAPKYVPTVMGFDPLFQFMHEEDVARAIATALDADLHGVFNVAGPSPLPLATIIRAVGHTAVPVPEPLLRLVMGRFGLPRLSRGAVAHVKHPVVVDASPFRKATGFKHRCDERETIESFRAAL